MATNGPHPSKTQRREAARAEALALRARQEAADRRARVVTASVLGLVVLALVAVVGFLVLRQHQDAAASPVANIPLAQVQSVPSTAQADGGIPVGVDRAAGGKATGGVPVVAVYVDYMCPYCGQFETVNKDGLEALLAGGKADLVVHPIALLDRSSQGTAYSTRAASASAWVADRDPKHWLDFHEALYAHQPKEQTSGLTNAQLAALARQAGVPGDVASGIGSGEARRTFGQWVYSATAAVTADPAFQGTPTITIDGTRWAGSWTEPEALPKAVVAATK
ncbi:MAG: DsbA family protein [Promicromonosporaceae bacterium]|nr:DsbA family protein [Promicromonosporaceae bacterium]